MDEPGWGAAQRCPGGHLEYHAADVVKVSVGLVVSARVESMLFESMLVESMLIAGIIVSMLVGSMLVVG